MEFRISSELKNIIGKDLIVNDEVAIFELVKNSYDAHATRVDIIFKKDKIIIKDNGKGMDLKDLKDKWLFVAYSAKKDDTEDEDIIKDKRYEDYRNKIKVKRGFAGAKGIGRFSSDRLGIKLDLISRKVNSYDIHKIVVNWEDFEKDSQKEFININVNHSILKDKEILYKNFKHGVILEISNLRTKWDDKKIESLKRSLGKLINPFEINTQENNFQIYIKKLNSMFDEPVKNELIDVLTMKTTKLEVIINKDKILSKLTDRGTLIYEIEEDNNYEYLKNSSIILLYLNQKAKYNFKTHMGVATNDFSNVMLYNNGFRVYPFGEPGDDSLGIDKRYQQGYNRYLSTRNIIGSININEYSNVFKEKSSRDSGLIETEGYKELEKLFWDKALKRLEKYVVGIQWSLEELVRKKDSNIDSSLVLNTVDSKSKIIELITKLVDKEKVEIKNFDTSFLNLIKDKIDPSSQVVLKLSKIALDTNNIELADEIEKAKIAILGLQKNNDELKKQVDKGQQFIDNLCEEKKNISIKLEKEKGKVKQLETTNKQKEKQVLFLQSERTLTEDELVNLQHHIGINAELINGSITNFKRKMDKKNTVSKDEVLDILDEVSIANQKIIAINKYATKADFLTNSETIKKDIIAFVEQYISNIHKVISTNKINVDVKSVSSEFITSFKPMEMTIIIDNIINNARKAKASKLLISFNVFKDSLELLFTDNGIGLDNSITEVKKVFEKGFTTTKGSGLGLYHIQKIINSIDGKIEIIRNDTKGITIKIGLKK